jgi:hypothetical protein
MQRANSYLPRFRWDCKVKPGSQRYRHRPLFYPYPVQTHYHEANIHIRFPTERQKPPAKLGQCAGMSTTSDANAKRCVTGPGSVASALLLCAICLDGLLRARLSLSLCTCQSLLDTDEGQGRNHLDRVGKTFAQKWNILLAREQVFLVEPSSLVQWKVTSRCLMNIP